MKKLFMAFIFCLTACFMTGCGANDDAEVTVTQVSNICGLGNVGMPGRFSGVVTARSEVEIKKDENKVIDEILVKEGDEVKEGQVLFTYDMEQATITLEKAQVELEQLKANVTAKEQEIKNLEKEKNAAGSSDKLSYTLAIQEAQTAIRETNYNIGLKESEIERLTASLESLDVKSTVNGKVMELNEEEGYDMNGQPLCFMRLMETGTYRIKGYINEINAGALIEGTPVIIRSRIDDSIWTGSISGIDWETPANDDQGFYYMPADDTQSSSKYPFYVELDSADGLMLGQHVYIEPDLGQESGNPDALNLPAFYICDIDNGPWVWAMSSSNKLEKRDVTLGEYNAELDTYVITEGLSADDYLAFPDETLEKGMKCIIFEETSPEAGPLTPTMAGGIIEEAIELR